MKNRLNLEERKEYIKHLFEECKKTDFVNSELEKIALINKTDMLSLKRLVKYYIFKYLDAEDRVKYEYIKKLGMVLEYNKIDTNKLGIWNSQNDKREFLLQLFRIYKKKDTLDLIDALIKKYSINRNEALNIINEAIILNQNLKNNNNSYKLTGIFKNINLYLGTKEEIFIYDLLKNNSREELLYGLDMFLNNYVNENKRERIREDIVSIINKKSMSDESSNKLILSSE